ncbi:MAG: alpha/beta hydrolase [Armatimonadetes bacterium]|nr:alpha/beta hydrolase [Armatimonadota bacterium]
MISPESREYLRRLYETPSFGADGFDLEGLRAGMSARRDPCDLSVRCLKADIEDIPGEWVLAPGADASLRILYLHGGGYVSGSGAFYLPLAVHISAAARCAVLLPDYRLAPEHRFPAGLEDCVTAYRWLRQNGPDGPGSSRSVFIAGDSAGGGLTLALLLALRDRRIPLPQGGIALSPFADLTLSGGSVRLEAERDPIMHPRCLPEFVRRYIDPGQERNPLASPLFGDYTGLPPILIQVGEREILRDDSLRTAEKARADGCEITCEIWEGMFHVFQSHDPLLPEARAAIARIAGFIECRLDFSC